MTIIPDDLPSAHHLQTWAAVHSSKHRDSHNISTVDQERKENLSHVQRSEMQSDYTLSGVLLTLAVLCYDSLTDMFQLLQCKQYTYRRGIKYSNHSAGKKIGTTVREIINSSPDLVIIKDFFSKCTSKYILPGFFSCFQLFTSLHPAVISLGTKYFTVFIGTLISRITLQLCWDLGPTAAHNERIF
jgi:hypothetical protein